MKVFVVWSVPDYLGIDIEGIFFHEKDANDLCLSLKKQHNKDFGFDGDFGVDEYEVK